MNETDTRDDLDDLDGLFAALRAREPAPSDALLGRIAADAAAAHLRPVKPAPVGAAPRPWHSFWVTIGGWPGGAALAASALLGLGLGLIDVAALDTIAGIAGDGEAAQDAIDVIDALILDG